MPTNVTSSMLQKTIQMQKESKLSKQNNSSEQTENINNNKSKKINKKKLAYSLAAVAGLSALTFGIIYCAKGGKKPINQPIANKPISTPTDKLSNAPSFDSKPVEVKAIIENSIPSVTPSVVPVVKTGNEEDIKAGMKIFLDRGNNKVEGVELKGGVATFDDGTKFNGKMKTRNKKGDLVTFKFSSDGMIVESKINGIRKKKYRYNKMGVDRTIVEEFNEAGKKKQMICISKDKNKVNNASYKTQALDKVDFLDDGNTKKIQAIFDERYGLIEKSEELYIGDYNTSGVLNSRLVSTFVPQKDKMFIEKYAFLSDGATRKATGGWNDTVKNVNDVNMDTRIDNIKSVVYENANRKEIESGSFANNVLSYRPHKDFKADSSVRMYIPNTIDGKVSTSIADYWVSGEHVANGRNITFYDFDDVSELSQEAIDRCKKFAQYLEDAKKFFEREGIDYNKEHTNKFITPFVEFFRNL